MLFLNGDHEVCEIGFCDLPPLLIAGGVALVVSLFAAYVWPAYGRRKVEPNSGPEC
jgi:hypothetical protein